MSLSHKLSDLKQELTDLENHLGQEQRFYQDKLSEITNTLHTECERREVRLELDSTLSQSSIEF